MNMTYMSLLSIFYMHVNWQRTRCGNFMFTCLSVERVCACVRERVCVYDLSLCRCLKLMAVTVNEGCSKLNHIKEELVFVAQCLQQVTFRAQNCLEL